MRTRRGFTIAEVLISMVLLLVITGAATQFLRKQSGLVTRETSRMDAMQNAQFAGSQIDRELREAGVGVADIQPMIVQLDTHSVTFNANMISIDTGDVRAVYQFRDADTNATRVMLKTERRTLPNSTRSYPDSTYFAATGVQSGAETISYYLRPDSTTSIANRYLLMRRANGQPATLVARGITKDSRDTTPFFTYYKTDTLNRLVKIPKASLPLYHNMIHGAPNDTAGSGLTDSIRAVRVHFLTASRDPRTGKDALRTVETLVRLMNSGLLDRTSCGQPPYSASAVVGVSSATGASVKFVNVSWTKSSDDNAGEKDIERYAIFRRSASATAFNDPISSIPGGGGTTTYTFKDTNVLADSTYVYGIAAQDCTPLLSGVVSSAAVTVNH